MNDQPLVKTPDAAEFFSSASTETGRKLLLGDRKPNETDPVAYNAIGRAHDAIVDGVAKVRRLADDPTRTDVMRHDAARVVAERTAAVLSETQATLIAAANRLSREAQAIVDEQFAVDPNRASLQSEIRSWIREQSSKPEGLKTIREAMNADREVAAVIYHSQHFLLGLAPTVRENMRIDAVEKHLPKTYKMLEQSIALNEQAAKYPKAIAKLHRAFYNKAIAVKAAQRVEV